MNALLKHYATRATHLCGMAYRHALYRLHGVLHDTVTVRTRQGLLTIPTRDADIGALGALLYRQRQYEFDHSIRAIKFLKSSGFIPASGVSMLDIGANIGPICIGLILSGEVKVAMAIEPEPHNFGLLRKNVEQNGLSDRILCLQMAVGAQGSTLEMELSANNPGDHRIREMPTRDASEYLRESAREVIHVPALPLHQVLGLPGVRDFGLSSPSLMWIDVQGYEGYVFKGGKGLLDEGLPTVSEVWPYGILRTGMSLEDFADIISAIWTDYWIERRDRFTRYPVAVFDRYLEELGTGGHFENVIFTKKVT